MHALHNLKFSQFSYFNALLKKKKKNFSFPFQALNFPSSQTAEKNGRLKTKKKWKTEKINRHATQKNFHKTSPKHTTTQIKFKPLSAKKSKKQMETLSQNLHENLVIDEVGTYLFIKLK